MPQRRLLHSPQIRPITNGLDLNDQLRTSSFQGRLVQLLQDGGQCPQVSCDMWVCATPVLPLCLSVIYSWFCCRVVLRFVTSQIIGKFSEVKKVEDEKILEK